MSYSICAPSKKYAKSGYTLLECVTVLSILTMLAFMTLPVFLYPISQKRLNHTVREMISVFELARLRAIRENTDVVISFDPENDGFLNGNYLVFLDNGSGRNRGNREWDEGERIIKTGKVLPGIELYEAVFGSRQAVRFNPMGLGLAGHVYYRGTRENHMGIRLSITGSARVIQSRDKGRTWQ